MPRLASHFAGAVFLMTNTFERGGTERQFVFLVKALRERGHCVEVGCIGRAGPFREEVGEVAEFPSGGSLYSPGSWRSRLALRRYLQSRRIAVAHAFDFYTDLMLVPVARLAGVPAVLGSHRQIGDLLGPARFRAQSLALRFSDCVVCNSQAAAKALRDFGFPERKIAVIPNGLARSSFDPVPPALARSPETLRVGMIARMNDPVKNYPAFLRAAALLAPKFPRSEFLLVGDGPLRPELDQLAQRLGLEGRARFLGERDDVRQVLASMDVSVLTSFSESQSNAVLESMAAGLPVVAARAGGNGDLVREGETGFLVPAQDAAAYAGAIERLLTDPGLRSTFGNKAKALAEANFSMEGVVGQYERLYSRLLERSKRRRSSAILPGNVSRVGPEVRRSRLRVAIIAPSLRYVGGQSTQANQLIREWENDPDVEARFIAVDPEFPRVFARVGKIPFVRTVLRTPLYLAALWRGLKGVDVAHIFSASYWSFLLAPFPALIVARARGAKTLINYRSGEARDHLSRWTTALPILRRADLLAVPSEYLRDVFVEFGLAARVIPNFIDETQFQYRPRQPLEPRLISTRGFGIYYGTDMVVRAFAHVKQRFPHATLSLVGSGSEEARVRSLVQQLGLSDVDFAGPVSRDEIGRCYDRADIFVNASWLDNMPVSILEAFAAGTPVVSTAPEGIRYIVRHEQTGLLCEPGDWQALALNVIRLLEEPALAEVLAENAYLESMKYKWSAVRSQWLDLYRSPSRSGRGERAALRRAPAPVVELDGGHRGGE